MYIESCVSTGSIGRNGEGEDGEDREDERMWGCEDEKKRLYDTQHRLYTNIHRKQINFKPLWIKRQDRFKGSPTYIFNNTKTLFILVILWLQKLCNVIYIFNFRNWDKNFNTWGEKADFPPSLPRILSFKMGEGFIPTVESCTLYYTIKKNFSQFLITL